jgi:hypothetical protein
MDKKFSKTLILLAVTVVVLPLILNLIVFVLGKDQSVFQAYASYFGAAIGGFATLVAIYLTVFKAKEKDHKPLIFFSNKHIYYYRNRNGIYHYFSNQYCNEDNIIREAAEPLNFEFVNIGHPAVDFKLSIIKLHEFMNVVTLLNVDQELYDKIDKSYYKNDYQYFSIGLVNKGDKIQVDPNIFENLLLKLLTCYYHNVHNKNFQNNEPFQNGWFKLFSLEANYSDIDGKNYSDVFSVYVHANSSHQPISGLRQFDIWELNIDFKKAKTLLVD